MGKRKNKRVGKISTLPGLYRRDENYRRTIAGDLEPVDIKIFQKSPDEKALIKLLKAKYKR